MMKSALGLGALVLGGAYFTGSLGLGLGGTWSRTVARPPATAMAALDTLDIRDEPGSPGTDPAASGGVMPMFKLERDATEMRWKVMSGDKVATTMFADFEPVDDGKQTKVTLHVERGDAPDDYVSPAFRSNGLTLGLFTMAVEDKLNRLVDPPRPADLHVCSDLDARFQNGNMAAEENKGQGLRAAIASGAMLTMRLNAYNAERRRLGCEGVPFDAAGEPGGDHGFADPVAGADSLPPPEVRAMMARVR